MYSNTDEYYQSYCGSSLNPYLSRYIAEKKYQDKKLNRILIALFLIFFVIVISLSKPIFAKTENIHNIQIKQEETVYLEEDFKRYIRSKYKNATISFPTKGIAHIKKIKFINKKPIKINVVEIDTKLNPNLKIKPQTATNKLNSKRTIRKIAQKENATIAINAGFFKPQTGVPLGALMIDRKILTGPIYNRVGIAIFDNKDNIKFKIDNINFDITAYSESQSIKLDNINQPRMLSTYKLLYTPDWGKQSPIAPKNCYNLLIANNDIIKISANPIEFIENSFVIQAPKEIISKLTKNKSKIYIDIKLQKNLQGATHIIGAGPYLVKDSEIYVDAKEQKLQAITGKNPRSAIGFREDGKFIITTIDGREKASVGMTLNELAKFMKEIGCEQAMNFDGGSSSALYVKGKITNSAINKEGIAVSNALIVKEIQKDELMLSSL